LGERQLAIDYLERCWQMRSPELLAIGADPLFDPVRDDARFLELLVKLQLTDDEKPPHTRGRVS